MAEMRHTASVVSRLVAVMVMAVLLLGVFLWVHHEGHHRKGMDIARAYAEDYAQQMERIILLSGEGLTNFVYDYSWWDDMVEFVQDPLDETEIWKVLGEGVPEVFRVQLVWVLDPEGDTVYSVDHTGEEKREADELGIGFDELKALIEEDPFPVFFTRYQGMPVQIAVSRIQYTGDLQREGEAEGYLLGGRIWDEEHFAHLGELVGGSFGLLEEYPGGEAVLVHEDGGIEIWQVARRLDGEPEFYYVNRYTLPGLVLSLSLLDEHSYWMVVIVLAFTGLFVGLIFYWVILPLRHLGRALNTQDVDVVSRLKFPGYEWEKLAQLITDDLRQRQALSGEISLRREAEEALVESEARLREHLAERERLARDLHDGVIQSVYATGLLLETAKAQLDQDVSKSRQALRDARDFLNVLITDIRRFIAGLGPASLHGQSFRDSLDKHIALLGEAGVQTEIDLCDSFLNKLAPSIKMHLYFIVQELLSNCLRHSRPRKVSLVVRHEGGNLCLRVENDGASERLDARSGGNGLKNIRQRAEILNADFTFTLKPDGTASAVLLMPLAPSKR